MYRITNSKEKLTLKEWIEKASEQRINLPNIKNANLILLPENSEEFGFPENTMELFRFLKNIANSEYCVEILADEKSFKENHLPDSWEPVMLASFFLVDLPVIPFVGWLMLYLSQRWAYVNRRIKLKVSREIAGANKNSVESIDFEGRTEDLLELSKFLQKEKDN